MAEKVPIIHETHKDIPEIPKSREIFTGDINDAVITVQKITGFEITPDWWFTNVGNEGSTETILDRFDTAFEVFVYEQMGLPSSEEAKAITEEQITAEADQELQAFDEQFGDDPGSAPLKSEFLDALEDHLKEKYFPDTQSPENMEKDMIDFKLTNPESRRYTADENYRFLMHVPLGDVEARGDEIGSERGGVLMTSLVTQEHQGTFQGYGGFILRQPDANKIKGMSQFDVGGEIQYGQMESVESLAEPADLTEYNQIDIDFDSTVVEAVLIKATSDGKRELGHAETNRRLRQFAEKHDLPVVVIEVDPMEPLAEPEVHVEGFPDGVSDMLHITMPSTEGVIRCRVLRAGPGHKVYNKLDGSRRLAGTSKVSQYGEYDQILSVEEEQTLIDSLRELQKTNPQIEDEDIDALQKEVKRLREERKEMGAGELAAAQDDVASEAITL